MGLDFESWRKLAREGLSAETPPARMAWETSTELQLFSDPTVLPATDREFRCPKEFLSLAKAVAPHRSGEQWPLLYAVLWDLTHGRPRLLEDVADPRVHRLGILDKQVRRDLHKMTAFVRFERVGDDPEVFAAWYEPDHLILDLAETFFRKRFGSMNAAILTPDGGLAWTPFESRRVPGPLSKPSATKDPFQDLWRSYFASTFNPARLKVRMMKREMPVRFWKNLPEAELIPSMIAGSSRRAREMIEKSREEARPTTVRSRPKTLDELRAGVRVCTACDLCESKRPGVPSRGPARARVAIVGEQPGDQEDREGLPFVGPAGRLLMELLAEIAAPTENVYFTNAVKHFRFVEQGKMRVHRRPEATHVRACRMWLEDELAMVAPEVVVCLGGTAIHSVLGYALPVGEARSRQDLRDERGARVIATYHPAALLRAMPEQARAWRADTLADLRKAFEKREQSKREVPLGINL